MFGDLKLTSDSPIYRQISHYIRDLIESGALRKGVRLPSTRELSHILKVSRNTVILAYQELQDDSLIENIHGQGAYVSAARAREGRKPVFDWPRRINDYGRKAWELNQTATAWQWRQGMIPFNSLAPDESIFEIEEIKRAFLNRIALEGEKLLNYGDAQGYRPLIEYLKHYLEDKGVDFQGKDLLITSGFTESFSLVMAALTNPGDRVICENPTHNLALDIMKLSGLQVNGVPMREDGIDPDELERALAQPGVKLGFIMPSYHNPTGLVMAPEKRLKVLELFGKYQVPLVEEGFNEELRHSGAHVSPLIALAGSGNGVVCLGSFSKILFPGIRIGWIGGDARLIAYLERIKFYRNIYTSLLDQAVLYEYLQNGRFQQYLKRAKKLYREKYEQALALARQYIPCRRVWGDGGLHLLIELDGIDARQLLADCCADGVLFTPGDIFYTDGSGAGSLRLSVSRVDRWEMEQGFAIIGEAIRRIKNGTGVSDDVGIHQNARPGQ
ncbi:GntR family transcriptional regulator [Hydrogenispora ethanolica]|jgi:DNA-binding transcriptional MocR family regulator|uniref:GntR family transcriptional regulator n=1 Tax=Hydrogenispora ethanolica TaxID=1082276 RepID=A0A4R1QSE6_HYDET|nr:PLP-dependent aminotransferase family protein [Hydrogenispora ethanolica]TCL56816.1 GntR family transcriptional regulator [Hydrogenispora ethanolica]